VKYFLTLLLLPFALGTVSAAEPKAPAAETEKKQPAKKKSAEPAKKKPDAPEPPRRRTTEAGIEPAKKKPQLDRSGKKQRGKASFYSRRFAGKKMADGTPMNPESNAAASRTLPLGTKARVTNLKNGRSAVVEIRDRGPYVAGRNIDVTPKTAKELDMVKDGVAPVEVVPIEVPPPPPKPGASTSG
jgi:rare lipoprotein A